MSNETIILAKNLDFKKVKYPVHVTEKFDGVPVIIEGRGEDFLANAITRQGEELYSIDHITNEASSLLDERDQVVGELYIPGVPFKDISGHARREKNTPELSLYVWDFIPRNQMYSSFEERMKAFYQRYNSFKPNYFKHIIKPDFEFAANEKQLKEIMDHYLSEKPEAEGLVIRDMDHLWTPGKRSWGCQRWKAEETVDLRLIGIEEAVSKDGEPKGMAGRLICDYKGKEIGVGPGNLTHNERKWLWAEPDRFINKIIEVAYKPDQSYEALREARFKRFRNDKTEPSY